MKSGISFFNAGFFRSNLKRFWPLWAAYFGILYVSLPLVTLLSGGNTESLLPTLRNYCGASCTVSNFFIGILAAMAAFSFMYNSRTVGMISSLPVRRGAVFTSAFLSGLLPVLAVNLLIAILTVLPAIGNNTAVAVQSVLVWFGVWSLQFFIFYCIATITAMVTGMLVALPVLYAIFNFLIPGIEMLIKWTLQIFSFGYSASGTAVTLFASPAAFIIETCSDIEAPWYNNAGPFIAKPLQYGHWATLAFYALAAVVCAVIALLMFRRREIERTGDVVAVKRLRPVFKYGVTACAALGLGLVFYAIFREFDLQDSGSPVLMSLTMILGAFIGYFASDMLLKKSFHVFRGNWRGFIAVAVICTAFVICCDADVFGVEGYVPDADDIEKVVIEGYDVHYEATQDLDEITDLHRAVIADRDKYERINVDTFGVDRGYEYFEIRYHLKSGRVVSREYSLAYDLKTGDPNVTSFRTIVNRVDAVLDRYTPSVEVNEKNIIYAGVRWDTWGEDNDGILNSTDLTPEQLCDLYYNAVIPDIKNGGYRTDREFINCEIYISFELADGGTLGGSYDSGSYDALTIHVDPNEPLTVQWIRDNLGWDIYPDVK